MGSRNFSGVRRGLALLWGQWNHLVSPAPAAEPWWAVPGPLRPELDPSRPGGNLLLCLNISGNDLGGSCIGLLKDLERETFWVAGTVVLSPATSSPGLSSSLRLSGKVHPLLWLPSHCRGVSKAFRSASPTPGTRVGSLLSHLQPWASPAHLPPGSRGRNPSSWGRRTCRPLQCALSRCKDSSPWTGQFPCACGTKMIETGWGGPEKLERCRRRYLQLRDVFARCKHVS